MNEVIRNIFCEKEFFIDKECLESQDSFLAERTEGNKFDFFTVMFETFEKVNSLDIEGISIKHKMEQHLANILEKKGSYIGLDKNLSLLLLLKVNSLEFSKERNSFINDMEEDPYDFKKYVLVYTQEQVDYLKMNVVNYGGGYIDYLNERLLDSQRFNEFKRGNLSEETKEYELVTNLFIKLPFLNMKHKIHDLSNLSKEIEKSIAEKDQPIWTTLLSLEKDSEEELSLEEIMQSLGVEEVE
ncbi:ABC-three component system middle component 1 [Bacillus cereus]|uniref:ABC-three component system middle component 1 n=1 Tax=Bacillus cereus TaxID=1396 RepID=UPI0018CE4CD0|nr:ABC-three component system middle component 1 [Bacillus cereus]MBG9716491.1 hypothetical protein [Bacillus cereus]